MPFENTLCTILSTSQSKNPEAFNNWIENQLKN